MAQIEDLEVQCEKDLFRVRIKFDRPFYGMVFSKGFYSNVNCVHVPAGLGQTQATFDIAMGQVSLGQSGSVSWLWLWFLHRPRVLVVLSARGLWWLETLEWLNSPLWTWTDPIISLQQNIIFLSPVFLPPCLMRLCRHLTSLSCSQLGTQFQCNFWFQCGMSTGGNSDSYGAPTPQGSYIENTVIVQYDPLLQEVWDQARKIRCTWWVAQWLSGSPEHQTSGSEFTFIPSEINYSFCLSDRFVALKGEMQTFRFVFLPWDLGGRTCRLLIRDRLYGVHYYE